MNGTLIALALVLLFVLLFMGMPIGTSLGIPVAILVAAMQITSFECITQFLYTKIADFIMLSPPFFLLAGDIMNDGGLSKRMVTVANSPIGNVTGILGAVTVTACMFFGAISGPAPTTVAVIGTIMISQIAYGGYDKGYAMGLVCVAGGLGIIVPSFSLMVFHGVTNGAPIGDMFLAGWSLSFVVGGVLIFINWLICKKRGYKSPIPKETSLKLLVRSVWEGKWALLVPIIILGGIYSGALSPTGAGAVSYVYGPIVGLFLYRGLDYEKILPMFRSKVNFLGGMMFYSTPAGVLGAVFACLSYTTVIKNFSLNISNNPYIIVLLICAPLSAADMFVQTAPTIAVISFPLLPVAETVGIDPVHFGIIITLTLAVAPVTPPMAYNLFVGASTSDMSIDRISKAAISFAVGLILTEIIVGFVLQTSMLSVNSSRQAAEKTDLEKAQPGSSPGIPDSAPVNGAQRGA